MELVPACPPPARATGGGGAAPGRTRTNRTFEEAVLRAIDAHALFAPGARLLVALSGGPDSVCLLAVLRALAARAGRGEILATAHFNHRQRGAASDRDALFAAATARAAAIACFVGEADWAGGGGSNLEARDRAARYAFLATVRTTWRADAICVAHTRDDQAETVLLRLARGGGPASLAAMPWRRADAVVRPLLDRSRAECRAYLRASRLIAVHDASNDDRRRLRNRVRLDLLPALERTLGVDPGQRLARLAGELRVENELAEQRVSALLDAGSTGGGLTIAALRDAGAGAGRLVHAWLRRQGVAAIERQIAAVVRVAFGRDPSALVDLAGGRRVVREYGSLRLALLPETATRPVPFALDLAVPGAVSTPSGWRIESVWLEPSQAAPAAGEVGFATSVPATGLSLPLRVRSPAPGDRIRLPGGRRKLADVVGEARVPRPRRGALSVVTTADDKVVWVPGVATAALAAAADPRGLRIALRAWRSIAGPGTPW